MRKFKVDVGVVPETTFDKVTSFSQFLNALVDMLREHKIEEFIGFDENLEGAPWIAVVQKPCLCCTVTFALDDDSNAVNELQRMFNVIGLGLQIPGRPSSGKCRLLGVYRKVT